jgi:hypothetical protein
MRGAGCRRWLSPHCLGRPDQRRAQFLSRQRIPLYRNPRHRSVIRPPGHHRGVRCQVAKQGALIYDPLGSIVTTVSAVAARESPDIVHNIEVLYGIVSTPPPIMTTM